MSDKPIVVSTKPLQLSGTVRGPIVVTQQEGDSGDTTPRLGYNQPTYKVKLVANGKTFNMLLPPSIESKHPGRSNPLQLPGLQIKANINISKLKIPGFFPIYQNLGVESLTISMSGMFTGYDGTNLLSAANWENSVGIGQSNVEQGQDSFTSASELYDFAVNNKALVQVTIYTSDGSFIPKQSTSTAFRDSSSNISFKGYIKEFEQVYIRQDRNYYLLRFEIVDFGSNKCKTATSTKKAASTTKTSIALGKNETLISNYRALQAPGKKFLKDLLILNGYLDNIKVTEAEVEQALIKANDSVGLNTSTIENVVDYLTSKNITAAPTPKKPEPAIPSTPISSIATQIQVAKKTLNISSIEIFGNGGPNLILSGESAVSADKVIDIPFFYGNVNKDVTATYIGNNSENYPLYRLQGTGVKVNKVVLKRKFLGFELLPSE
jgi:hypothetical protein